MSKLSIIIPCYNCEETLETAVASIYRQKPVVPFDLTMVDDGSSDGTYDRMKRLAAEHSNIKLLRHASNLGGGAARNTAVVNSDGDLIFCLDSDDMLGPDFLSNMTKFWLEKRSDGIGISKSIKFKGRNTGDVAYITEFDGPGRVVPFESLLDSSVCSLYSTFLITRAAFDRIGGYPTDHGFDTQGMAFRFLCNGLRAYTCPGTIYYHRVKFHESYYMREDRAGRSHWNMFQILNEFLYLFTNQVKRRILEYDFFPTQPQRLLVDELRLANEKECVFRDDYRELVRLGRDQVASGLKQSTDKYDQYWVGTYLNAQGRYAEALGHFVQALQSGFNHGIIYCWLLEAALKSSGYETPASISLGDLIYHVNDLSCTAESSAPRLSRYQDFENRLFRHPTWSLAARLLKKIRMFLRRLRRNKAS
jgi:glycosyltransferase involved in cell wall biosynthesis